MRSSSTSKSSNRRRHRRLRTDRLLRVPVQVFPVLPFVGPSVEGAIINLSTGGMALLLNTEGSRAKLTRGARLRVHFRLPGLPLTQCRGVITHAVTDRPSGWLRLGVRFVSTPSALSDRINRMVTDDGACDARMDDSNQARCDLACSFHSLCSKPIRETAGLPAGAQFEIALQRAGR